MPKSSSEPKEPKRSFFEWNSVKLKGVERELARLNRNIELYLLHGVGVDVNELKRGEAPDDEITYATDMSTLRNEIEESQKGFKEEDPEELEYTERKK